MTSRPARLVVASILVLGPLLPAQELRHADNPLFSSACYDSVRARVIGVGLNGYSHEWDGVS